MNLTATAFFYDPQYCLSWKLLRPTPHKTGHFGDDLLS